MTTIRIQRTIGLWLAILIAPSAFAADVVSDWNTIMLTTISSQNSFAQSRFATITQLAVFEALNEVSGVYKPYLGVITAPPGASPEAAVVAAAHRVLRTYFSGAAATLDAARESSLAAIPEGPSKVNGIAVGEAAATALIALRENDGSGASLPYTPMSGPGFWQPTPPALAPATLLHWARVTPFALRRANQFRPNRPPALTTRTYRRDYEEVREVGAATSAGRPQDRADVAQFFAATSPVQVWNRVAQQLAAADGLSLLDAARALALMNIAIADSSIAVFEAKYFYQTWRPVTAIRAGDTDANPATGADPAFSPFIGTPTFPGYPSAHAAGSNAARYVLEQIFGGRRYAILLTNPALPSITLQYTKLGQITDDIDDARVYGGIHFRFDQEAGAELGRRVAEHVYRQKLRCLSAATCGEEEQNE